MLYRRTLRPGAQRTRNNHHPPASPAGFHFPSPAARASIGGTGRRPSYYRPRARRARDDTAGTQLLLTARKRAVCLPLSRLPSARGGLAKGSFPLPSLCKGRWLAKGKTEGLLSTPPVYDPPASLRLPYSLYKGRQGSDAITRFQFRSVHRQSRACTRNLSAEFRYQRARSKRRGKRAFTPRRACTSLALRKTAPRRHPAVPRPPKRRAAANTAARARS